MRDETGDKSRGENTGEREGCELLDRAGEETKQEHRQRVAGSWTERATNRRDRRKENRREMVVGSRTELASVEERREKRRPQRLTTSRREKREERREESKEEHKGCATGRGLRAAGQSGAPAVPAGSLS